MQTNERSGGRIGEKVPCSSILAGVWCFFSHFSILTFLDLQVEAETQADIAESFEIEAVPTFLLLRVCNPDFHGR